MPPTTLSPSRMRLIIVIHSLEGGGAERVTATLANEWARRGWTVTVATLADSADSYRLDPAIGRVRLRLAAGSRGVGEAIRHNGVRVLRLRRFLRREQPDVVLAMMATSAVLCILASRGLGTRVIVSERIHPPMLDIGRFWSLLRCLTYPMADRVVVLTSETRRWLQARQPRVRATVIPNPVCLPLAAGEPVLDPDRVVAADRQILLAVGRLDPQKGFDVLIEAFAHIADRCPQWTLAIVGDGPGRDTLAAQVRVAGLGSRVVFPGRVGNLADWYRRAGLFVLSSRFEGFPNVLIEAMAHGCAVVSFDCDTGPRDIVRDAVDGILVRPVGSVDALAESLQAVMADEALRSGLAACAREVAERFSLERVMQSWDEVLCGRRDRGRPLRRSCFGSVR